jgi:Tfp pilus assembly protein PilF
VNLALAYYKTSRISAAAEELEKAIQQQPSNRQAVFLLADCDLRLGEYKKVIELLAPLEKESPNDKALIYLLGTALIRDNQPARGQLLVDRILREGESAEARLLLGTTKMNAQDFAEALVDLKKASSAFRKELESNPNDFVSNLQLGVIFKQDQRYDEALSSFERALRVRPGDPAVRYQLATLDLMTGNVEQACSKLEQLTRETPQFVEAHVSLATVYYRLKRKADGDRERATVLKLNAESQAAQPGAKMQ